MATFDGNDMGGIIGGNVPSSVFRHYPAHNMSLQQLIGTAVSPSIVSYYKMRGKDVDCGPLTYRTWVVSGAPDPTGALYVGARCGVTPFTEVVIAETWQV